MFVLFMIISGKGDLSLRAYERSIEIDPKHRVSHVNYGRQLKIMERHQEAEVAYRRYLFTAYLYTCLHIFALLNRVKAAASVYKNGRIFAMIFMRNENPIFTTVGTSKK